MGWSRKRRDRPEKKRVLVGLIFFCWGNDNIKMPDTKKTIKETFSIIGTEKVKAAKTAFQDSKQILVEAQEASYTAGDKDYDALQILIIHFDQIVKNLEEIEKDAESLITALSDAMDRWTEQGVDADSDVDAKLYNDIIKSLQKLTNTVSSQLNIPLSKEYKNVKGEGILEKADDDLRAEDALYRGENELNSLQTLLQKFKYLIPVDEDKRFEMVVTPLTDALEVFMVRLTADFRVLAAYKQMIVWKPGKGAECAKSLKRLHKRLARLKPPSSDGGGGDNIDRPIDPEAVTRKNSALKSDPDKSSAGRKFESPSKQRELAEKIKQTFAGQNDATNAAENALIRDVLAYYH